MEKSSQPKASFGQGLELAIVILKAFATIAKKIGPSSSGAQKLIDKPGIIYKCVENLFSESVVVERSILKIISAGDKIIIESSDGKLLISKAKKTFNSWIDPCFNDWKLNEPGVITPETLLDIYEVSNNVTFLQMFSDLSSDLDKLVMTQSQIILFCEKYPNWLRSDGCATFFLTKVKGEYLVVRVFVNTDGLYVQVNRSINSSVWSAGSSRRVVAPQIKS